MSVIFPTPSVKKQTHNFLSMEKRDAASRRQKFLTSKQAGMTLVEIMISLLIGAILLGGVLQIFLSTKQTYRMQEGISRLQENARFAMEFLTRDLRMAGLMGCLSRQQASITNNLNPSGTGYDPQIHNFQQNIAGTNGTAGANAALDQPDSITLQGALGTGLTIQPPFGPQASAVLKVASDNGLKQGDIILVSDCSKGDIFQISNANPDSSGNLVHNTGNVTEPGNFNPSNPGCPGMNAHCLSKVYNNEAQIYQVSTFTYSIQNGANGEPALWLSTALGSSTTNTELVENIENMQILYGEDANSDGAPDYYVPAGTAGLNMTQVVSVRVSILASTENGLSSTPLAYTYNGGTTTFKWTAPTQSDRRIRRVFTSTIAIRNRLP
ncbi:MAG: PilW family protein [Methylomicrobium sp.]|nr:PilW family protein [Methylomicrobium sp.]